MIGNDLDKGKRTWVKVKLSNNKTKNFLRMKRYLITVNQTQYEVEVVEIKAGAAKATETINAAPRLKPYISSSNLKENKAPLKGNKVTAIMPGSVIKVFVSPGDVVKKGQKLLVFEAMKMENDLTSPIDGVVSEVKTSEGAVISAGEVLIIIE